MTHIAQAEGIGLGRGKGGAAGAAGVLEVQGVATVITDQRIEIAVAVEVGEGRGGTLEKPTSLRPKGLVSAAWKFGVDIVAFSGSSEFG
ncbi:hypothetical protein [Allochromatium palmeri]|uniref:Uncharacterized protein n=1 Tax=Allochromatium palmeri TaxID=231048 RepID=A0A6N8ELD7_9GAMM|nr:hypothetical protein [Allochromatium palmeri]MTW23144.1 hypothetical protein [Allochromatium palmeri]